MRCIDFNKNILTIKHTVVKVDKVLRKKDSTKNGSSYRVMPISEFIKRVLLELKKEQELSRDMQPNDYIDEGYIFTHIDGRLITPDCLNKRFKKILKKRFTGYSVSRFKAFRCQLFAVSRL